MKVMKQNKFFAGFGVILVAIILSSLVILPYSVYAMDREFYSSNDIQFYDSESGDCSASNSLTGIGLDYSGREILNTEQRAALQSNRDVYEEAEKQTGVPWELIAVLHFRENRFSTINPENGQGLYQELEASGTDKYPYGQVSNENFIEQSVWAGNFIKNKVSDKANLLGAGDEDTIKEALFKYNGAAEVYKEQATKLGFTNGFEGSPYVMNKADAIRDPEVAAENTWGQIKDDGGELKYPANDDYGAFVVYSAIIGVSSDCNSVDGSVVNRVVAIAQQELALWNNGSLLPKDGDYKKYTNGQAGNWCAWFSSWVYNQAGYPLSESSTGGEVRAVETIRSIGQEGGRFVYNEKDGYTPRVADLVIQKSNGASHVHIVTAVDGENITVIGGNQGYASGGGQATDYSNSSVTEFTYNYKDSKSISGFVSIAG